MLNAYYLNLARDEAARAVGLSLLVSKIWNNQAANHPLLQPTFQDLQQTTLDQLLDSPGNLDPSLISHLRTKLPLIDTNTSGSDMNKTPYP